MKIYFESPNLIGFVCGIFDVVSDEVVNESEVCLETGFGCILPSLGTVEN